VKAWDYQAEKIRELFCSLWGNVVAMAEWL